MATPSGPPDSDVIVSELAAAMREHPGRFDFFQLVRLIERMYPGRVPVGEFGPPAREALSFRVNPSLAFPPSQIHALEWEEGSAPSVSVNFLGLTGPMGVLPVVYTELLRDRARLKDRALRDFFDLFHHRILSLFYQAWKKYRFYVPFERGGDDRFSAYLRSFVGLGTGGLRDRQQVRDESFLFYGGLLSLQARSAVALEQILSDYFRVPAAVEQYVGAWYPVPAADQCEFERETGYSDTLGTAIVGDEVWDVQSRARVVLGPMPLERYAEFLPAPVGSAHEALRTILRVFSGNEIEYEVQLVLAKEEVPRCELTEPRGAGALLGWTTWIRSGDDFGRDPGDTVLLLN